jgi:hypothetical protein
VSGISRESFEEHLTVECYPQITHRTLARATSTEEIAVTDPKTDTEEQYEVADFAQGMARVHLRAKARGWFADDYYEQLVGSETDASSGGNDG